MLSKGTWSIKFFFATFLLLHSKQNKTKKQHNQYGNHIIINLYLITVSKRSFGLVLNVGGRDEGSASDAETQLDAPEYDIELVDLLQFVGTREVVRS